MAPKFQYTQEQMKLAIKAVRSGMSRNKAAQEFKVPPTTLSDKLTGKTPMGRKMGPRPTLTDKEERHLLDWIVKGIKMGYPPKKEDIIDMVEEIIKKDPKRVTPFKNGRPGKRWWESFVKRNAHLNEIKADCDYKEISPKIENSMFDEEISAELNEIKADYKEICPKIENPMFDEKISTKLKKEENFVSRAECETALEVIKKLVGKKSYSKMENGEHCNIMLLDVIREIKINISPSVSSIQTYSDNESKSLMENYLDYF